MCFVFFAYSTFASNYWGDKKQTYPTYLGKENASPSLHHSLAHVFSILRYLFSGKMA